MAISEFSNQAEQPAVRGENTAGGIAIHGVSISKIGAPSTGVFGESKTWQGVHGRSESSSGVLGESKTARGVHGTSESSTGVNGESKTGVGVWGFSENSTGTVGESKTARGVHGTSESSTGVNGISKSGRGVHGVSETGIGVHGKGGSLAGFFEGDVEVTGDIRLRQADCAEEFDISGVDKVEPGTVMVLGNEGTVQPSSQSYDKRVAGVISGAGSYRPGIVLDKLLQGNRQPIALLGKVYCKVNADYAPIEIGDLLTTSDTPGYAMKAIDPMKAFGAVIGKALQPLQAGQGLIPILISLQ